MRKVLIIDDDSIMCQYTKTSLELLGGWETIVASSGEEGLIVAQIEKPDAILLDLTILGMDAITTLHYLRSNPITQPIPVILFTNTPPLLEQQTQKTNTLAVSGIILKPFGVSELVEQIRCLLKLPA